MSDGGDREYGWRLRRPSWPTLSDSEAAAVSGATRENMKITKMSRQRKVSCAAIRRGAHRRTRQYDNLNNRRGGALLDSAAALRNKIMPARIVRREHRATSHHGGSETRGLNRGSRKAAAAANNLDHRQSPKSASLTSVNLGALVLTIGDNRANAINRRNGEIGRALE